MNPRPAVPSGLPRRPATPADETYRVIPALDLDPCEVEASGPGLVEVQVHWGDELLQVDHLGPGRSFELASPEDAVGAARFEMDGSLRGACGPQPLLLRGDDDRLLVPSRTAGVGIDGRFVSRRELLAAGRACRSQRFLGALEVVLQPGSFYSLELGGLRFSVRHVAPARRLPGPRRVDRRLLRALLATALVVLTGMAGWQLQQPVDGAERHDERLDRLHALVLRRRVHLRVPAARPPVTVAPPLVTAARAGSGDDVPVRPPDGRCCHGPACR